MSNIHQQVVDYVKKQIGIDIKKDASFPNAKKFRGYTVLYFDTGERSWDGNKFTELERISGPDKFIKSIEVSGVERVAIFL